MPDIGETILNRSPLDESVLISMNYLQDDFLETVGKDFGDYLETTVEQGDGVIVVYSLGGLYLGYQCDIACVNTLEI